MRAPSATVTRPAARRPPASGPAPCRPPPIRTRPPPVAPEASTRAVDASVTAPPVTSIVPPWAAPEPASSAPEISTRPAPPSSTMAPPSARAERASITPPTLIAASTASRAAEAVMTTVPPSLTSRPRISARPVSPAPGSSISNMPSPDTSTEKVSRPAITTLPTRPSMTPRSITSGATIPTRPASAKLMRPSLTIFASGLPGRSKVPPPRMNLSGSMSAVDSTSPPTSTTAPAWTKTPLGFTSQTLPLASSLPRMWLGSESSTRFSATEPRSGCRNCTVSDASMSKLRQSIITRRLSCRITLRSPEVSMEAAPPVTTPPFGPAAAPPAASASATAAPPSRRARTEGTRVGRMAQNSFTALNRNRQSSVWS